MNPFQIIEIGGSLAVGLLISYLTFKPKKNHGSDVKVKLRIEQVIHEAQKESELNIFDVQEKVKETKKMMEDLEERHQVQIEKMEKVNASLDERIKLKEEENSKIQKAFALENQSINLIEKEISKFREERIPALSKVSQVSVENMRETILSDLKNDLELTREDRLRKLEEYLKEDRERIAKNLLVNTIQRYSAPTSVEKKSMIIPVVRDETRLKIMGKNAEHIIFLEQELGVDIVFNDINNTVIVSCFDLVKKHIARETIVRIMKERQVSLDKLKLRLADVRRDTERQLVDIGRKVVKDLHIERRNFPPDFLKILGRLKFRTSYGQNILKHSFEVGYFTLMLGGELGLNMEVCKIGGFFHDLGKAIDQEDGRPHDYLTKEIMEKFHFPHEETHAAWSHHDAIPQETAEAMLVKAGDAISAGRPGARQETIEKYLARIHAMEDIAKSYGGVQKTYAISGGREIRVLVNPRDVNDKNLPELAKAIASDIEANVAYPGKIKINIIRRVQSSSVAVERKPKV